MCYDEFSKVVTIFFNGVNDEKDARHDSVWS